MRPPGGKNHRHHRGIFYTLLIGMVGGMVGFATIELMGVLWINLAPNLDKEIRTSFLLACLTIPATTATAGLRGVIEGERFKVINLLKLILGNHTMNKSPARSFK